LVINKNDRTIVIQSTDILPKEVPMSTIEGLMLLITNPQVAYLLFMIGIYGLIYELAHPGAIFPGVIGGTSLVLAILAFNYLPITTVGVVLILLGIAFMIAELKVPGVGILAVGGIICFILGSFLLIDRNYGEMVIKPETYVPMAAMTVVLLLIVLPRIWRAMKRKVATGVSGIIGNVGVVTTDLSPVGKIHVHGEYWDARTEDGSAIQKNSKVVVVGKNQEEMQLVVKRREEDWSKSNMPQI
jgi:membrane-bound serine protease (ClpP class)